MKYISKHERASVGADLAAALRLVRGCSHKSIQPEVTNELIRAARFIDNALETMLALELRKEPTTHAQDQANGQGHNPATRRVRRG